MNQFFSVTVNKPRKALLYRLSIFYRTTLRGILSFYFWPYSSRRVSKQNQAGVAIASFNIQLWIGHRLNRALHVQHCFSCLLGYQGIIRGDTVHWLGRK